jgi:ribosomal protein S27AE
MALETKDNAKCPRCGRSPVRLYKTSRGWICGKCARQTKIFK